VLIANTGRRRIPTQAWPLKFCRETKIWWRWDRLDSEVIENHRTGLIWKTFMSNPEIQQALDAIGFHKD
jgi:hypothetical protein